MGCSPPGSSIHGIFQARIVDWVAVSSSRGLSWLRDRTCVFCVSCIAGSFFSAESQEQEVRLGSSCKSLFILLVALSLIYLAALSLCRGMQNLESLTHRLSSCRVQAQLLWGKWALNSPPGIESKSPALQGRFLTTGPQRKSQNVFKKVFMLIFHVLSWLTLIFYTEPMLPAYFLS